MKKYIIIIFVFLSFSCESQVQISGVQISGVQVGGFTPIDFTGITNSLYFGNSIMNGSNASAGNSYRELLNASFSTNNNQAASGRGVWNEIKNLVPISYTRSATVIWESGGLNDIRRSHTQQTKNKIVSVTNTFVASAFAKSGSSVSAGSSSTTRVGTWAGQSFITLGGYSSSSTLNNTSAGCTSTALNATLSWTFTGTKCFIIFSATDPTLTRSDCEVRIDGNLVETITDLDNRYDAVNDGSYDNKRGPDTRIYTGLSSGSHTIEIKVIESGKTLAVDLLGIIDDPANVGVLMVIQVPYIVNYGIATLDQASDAYIDEINGLREAIVSTWSALGYRIAFAKIMVGSGGFYNLINCDTDGVHPTTAGHLQIYNSLIRYKN